MNSGWRPRLQDKEAELEAKLKIAIEALEFYEKVMWWPAALGDMVFKRTLGDKAREALAEIEKIK